MPERALVVVPTYNERENLPQIVPAILAQDPRLDVLVVDVGSPDGTGQLADAMAAADPRVHVLHRTAKQGLGRAYLAGFTWALPKGYDFIFEMDADFSHDPKALPAFLTAIQDADLVLGSRYATGVNVINWPMSRLLLSWFANKYVHWITRLPLTDATGGFKCFRREALQALDFSSMRSDGYCFQIETTYKIWKKGLRVREIPIVFADRTLGTSKMSGGIISEAFFLVLRLRLHGGK